MTKGDVIRELQKLQEFGDREIAHSAADDLLIAFINDEEIKEAFEAVPKWYA